MKPALTKSELLAQIEASRRQLDRTLFYFEKDPGGAFVPSQRFRYTASQAMAPGVVGNWSLYQVLSQVRSAEQAFLNRRSTGEIGAGGFSPLGIASSPGVLGGPFDALPVQSLAEFLPQYRDSYQQLRTYLGGMHEEALFAPQPTLLVEELLEASLRQYVWAKGNIQRWRKESRQAEMTRAALLDRIGGERRRLESTLAGLSPEQMELPGVIGRWSVKDILAHLAAWEALFCGWYQAGLRGETPELPAPGFTWREMDALNEQIYQQHCAQPLAEVQAWFSVSHQRLLEEVAEIPEEVLFSKPLYAWQGKYRLVTYVLANSAQHDHWAEGHIRNWLKRKRVSQYGKSTDLQ
jgi:hypothetical protein